MYVLYNFDQFTGHKSQGVPDMSKFGSCHGSWRGADEKFEL
jgi:hypothetical protein